MTAQELEYRVSEARDKTREALQTVYNELNQGQQKKILKNDGVRALFDLYGVQY